MRLELWVCTRPDQLAQSCPIYVHVCFYRTGFKLADCQILFYHNTRGLKREIVLCMIIAHSEGF